MNRIVSVQVCDAIRRGGLNRITIAGYTNFFWTINEKLAVRVCWSVSFISSVFIL